MIDFTNKKIGILGIGMEGVSSARYLAGKGATVTVMDQKEEADLNHEEIAEFKKQGVQIVTGNNAFNDLGEYAILVRSPGIKRDLPEILKAETRKTIVTSQTKLFFDLCPAEIIGVTGTKGKGTTSSLIYAMLKAQNFDAYLGGNIGKPPFSFLDKLTPESKVVLEMSSFQLQDLTKSPHIGVLLMMTQEHLAPDKKDSPSQNFHTDIYEYIDAKRNIIRFQHKTDFAVLNRDYIASNESDLYTDAKVFYVSRERAVENGAFKKDNAVWLSKNGQEQKIIDTKDILLPGGHNVENVCAAVAAATLTGVKKEAMVKVITTFKGLEHRLELVDTVNEVRYYDDSFSTTPETAIAAIEAFTDPKIIILGGASKNSDFTELGRVIRESKSIKAIIGIGLEWEKIKEKIQDSRFKIYERCKNMPEIVKTAYETAEPGDVVLLSPACSSFDMFKNYKERGEQFKKEVHHLSSLESDDSRVTT